MKSEKDKPPSRFALRKYLAIILFSLILAVIVDIRLPLQSGQYQIGDIATRNIRSTANYKVPGSDVSVKKGEIIVREGQRIGPEEELKLAGLSAIAQKRPPITGHLFFLFFIFFSFITIVYEFADRNIKKFTLSEKDFIFSAALTGLHSPADQGLARSLRAVRSRSCLATVLRISPLPLRHRHEDHPFFRSRRCLFHHSRGCGSVHR